MLGVHVGHRVQKPSLASGSETVTCGFLVEEQEGGLFRGKEWTAFYPRVVFAWLSVSEQYPPLAPCVPYGVRKLACPVPAHLCTPTALGLLFRGLNSALKVVSQRVTCSRSLVAAFLCVTWSPSHRGS